MTMADEKTARYVAYIDSLITVSPKSQSAISREIGYKNPNILSLIKKGRIPLPVEKVLPLAEALNADPVRLMMMVLEEWTYCLYRAEYERPEYLPERPWKPIAYGLQ